MYDVSRREIDDWEECDDPVVSGVRETVTKGTLHPYVLEAMKGEDGQYPPCLEEHRRIAKQQEDQSSNNTAIFGWRSAYRCLGIVTMLLTTVAIAADANDPLFAFQHVMFCLKSSLSDIKGDH